jgi:hypothetical protein
LKCKNSNIIHAEKGFLDEKGDRKIKTSKALAGAHIWVINVFFGCFDGFSVPLQRL